jgi:hypothetical protein
MEKLNVITKSIKTKFCPLILEFKDKVLNLLDDPLNIKKRRWDHYDNWIKSVYELSENKTNRRFLVDDEILPKFSRPRSMLLNKD